MDQCGGEKQKAKGSELERSVRTAAAVSAHQAVGHCELCMDIFLSGLSAGFWSSNLRSSALCLLRLLLCARRNTAVQNKNVLFGFDFHPFSLVGF